MKNGRLFFINVLQFSFFLKRCSFSTEKPFLEKKLQFSSQLNVSHAFYKLIQKRKLAQLHNGLL